MGIATPVVVTARQRSELKSVIAARDAHRGHSRRARVVLAAAAGHSNMDIAAILGLSVGQVSRIRARFLRDGVGGLTEQKRSGRGNNLSHAVVERVIATALSPPPAGFAHWSGPQLAKRLRIGKSSVQRVLAANGVKPHLTRTFKISKDPDFEAKVRDVVGLYLHPPDRAIVLSLDEKTQIQALQRMQPSLPIDLGRIRTRTHDYIRHGVLDLYAAINVATGKVHHRCATNHTAKTFLQFMNQIVRAHPETDIHVILDNSSSHDAKLVEHWLARHPRVTFHFTPTSASWINQVEGVFSILTRRSLKYVSFQDLPQLRRHITAFLRTWNVNPKPFTWRKSSRAIVRDHRSLRALISGEED